MEIINAIIIDDEYNVREALRKIILKYCKNINILGMASSAEEAVYLINKTNPDLVFLDVQINEQTGFEILKEIPLIDFDIIFVTSYDKYAIKAIKYCALDYILKPVDVDELKSAIVKFDKKRKEQISVLLENLNSVFESKKIVIKHSKGIKYAYDDEIIRCEGEGNYSNVYFTDHTKLLVAKTLKEFEDLLPQKKFFRIHQSHLINLGFAKSYKSGRGGEIEMTNGDLVKVSRIKKQELLKRLA